MPTAYRRLEFVFDIGQGPRVLAFVDFSRHISFGIPKSFQFADVNIGSSGEDYERITIHEDGKIKTHLPLGQNSSALWDGQYPPLARWNRPWSMKESIYWGNQRTESVMNYLTRPKIGSPGTRQVQLAFPREVEETTVVFSLFHSLGVNIEQVPAEIRSTSFVTWMLVDPWPYVLVSVANLGIHQTIQLGLTGRDYRVS
jgi:hypothetical protein